MRLNIYSWRSLVFPPTKTVLNRNVSFKDNRNRNISTAKVEIELLFLNFGIVYKQKLKLDSAFSLDEIGDIDEYPNSANNFLSEQLRIKILEEGYYAVPLILKVKEIPSIACDWCKCEKAFVLIKDSKEIKLGCFNCLSNKEFGIESAIRKLL